MPVQFNVGVVLAHKLPYCISRAQLSVGRSDTRVDRDQGAMHVPQ